MWEFFQNQQRRVPSLIYDSSGLSRDMANEPPRCELNIEPSPIAASLERIFGVAQANEDFQDQVKKHKYVMPTKLKMDYTYDARFVSENSYKVVAISESTSIVVTCPKLPNQDGQYQLAVYMVGKGSKKFRSHCSKEVKGEVISKAIQNYMSSQGAGTVLAVEQEAIIATLDALLLSLTGFTKRKRFRDKANLRIRSKKAFLSTFRKFSKEASNMIPDENLTREYLDQLKTRIDQRVEFIKEEIKNEQETPSENQDKSSKKQFWIQNLISILLFSLSFLKLKWVFKGL